MTIERHDGHPPGVICRPAGNGLCEPLMVTDGSYGVIQVVLTPAVQEPFREWLASRGLNLFPIPVEDDLPTYGVGFEQGEKVAR